MTAQARRVLARGADLLLAETGLDCQCASTEQRPSPGEEVARGRELQEVRTAVVRVPDTLDLAGAPRAGARADRRGGTVSRVDPVTNRATATIPVGGPEGPEGMTFGARALWVSHKEGAVTRIDPATNTVVARIS